MNFGSFAACFSSASASNFVFSWSSAFVSSTLDSTKIGRGILIWSTGPPNYVHKS
jgi:hypothetical protein